MSRTIWVGAVAYDPKVVTIWEGMRRYFHEEAILAVEVVLFQSYEAQLVALLAAPGDRVPQIDLAWNTNLAYLQADAWSDHRCRPIAMRDTDIAWRTKIVAVKGGPVAALTDLKDRSVKAYSRAGSTVRYASTMTLASMVIRAPARSKLFVRSSTAVPTPAQSAARSGGLCKVNTWCRRAL